MMDHRGKLPASLDELFQFASNNYKYGNKPLLKKEDLIDSWGEPIEYIRDGRRYALWSSGPDKKMGTKDDVYDGSPTLYKAVWEAKYAQAIAQQETNTVQGATAGAIQPPVGVGETQPNSVPAITASNYTFEAVTHYLYECLKATPPEKILLYIGVIVVGVMAVLRCFRKGKRESGIKSAIRFILECIAVYLATTLLFIATVGAYDMWRYKRKHPHPRTPSINIQMSIINTAIIGYEAQEGKLPVSLDVLTQRPYGLKKETLVDPWGEVIRYEYSGEENFIIWSSGPDKKTGTADDRFDGYPKSYVESWRAKLMQSAEEQETNTVQGATAGTAQLPASVGKTPSNSLPVTTTQPTAKPDNPAETKTTPWKLPLLVGIAAIIGTMAAWRCFRRK